jgi:hypothetical protein
MRSTPFLLIAAIGLAVLLGAPNAASAGWGGTHASAMVYPQYVYHPPYRSYRSRACRYRADARCVGAPHDHPWLQLNPRAHYGFHNLGWNW